ncbi:Hypothetical predicted protein [Octopus vulgaris]|uniref:Zinc finger MYM-type protein 1-like n=1 Tax=Octopus vulgaris TaxID=6645 RepID=A0AA36ARE0_OCTVU|nr:Hypothetical predicted protein [Octopus vulgaris]
MAMLKHGRSQRHIKRLIDLKILGNVRIDLQLDERKNQSIQHHNEKVRRNRSILQRLIDVVIFLGLQELSFRGHFESEGSNDRGNYKELVYLISKYDKKCDGSADRSANALSEQAFKCIETWECGNKLIAQTYDGAATMAGQLNGLQAKSKSHDIVYCKEKIDKTRTVLEKKLDNFSIFYDRLGEKYGVDAGIGIQRSKNISIDPQRHYRMLYNKIISTIVDQIKARYSSLEEFKFMELLNFNKVDEYCKQFPVDSLDSLRTTYGRFFDVIRLQSEIM